MKRCRRSRVRRGRRQTRRRAGKGRAAAQGTRRNAANLTQGKVYLRRVGAYVRPTRTDEEMRAAGSARAAAKTSAGRKGIGGGAGHLLERRQLDAGKSIPATCERRCHTLAPPLRRADKAERLRLHAPWHASWAGEGGGAREQPPARAAPGGGGGSWRRCATVGLKLLRATRVLPSYGHMASSSSISY